MGNAEVESNRCKYTSSDAPIVCLCSAFGLGMYIPGLLLREGIRARGSSAYAEVLESILTDDALAKVERSRNAYRASFKLALAAQQVPIDIRESIDPEKMAALFQVWREAKCQRFVCLSGHWVFVLNMYRDYLNSPIEVDLLYVDASMPPSWRHLAKILPSYRDQYNETFLYDLERLAVQRFIDAGFDSVSYESRDTRLVIHGGGWGFGKIDQAMIALADAGLRLEIVGHQPPEDPCRKNNHVMFADDPGWRAWHLDGGHEIGFPPFARCIDGLEPRYIRPTDRHGLYDSICDSRAIVSKPGGGTLLDSFSSATPLIMLEPFGVHEANNGNIWCQNGFGIHFSDWARTSFSLEVLCELHYNLQQSRSRSPDYVSELLER